MLQAVYTTYHTASANHKTLQIAAWIQMRLVMVTTPPKLCPKSKAITTISLTTSPMSSETSLTPQCKQCVTVSEHAFCPTQKSDLSSLKSVAGANFERHCDKSVMRVLERHNPGYECLAILRNIQHTFALQFQVGITLRYTLATFCFLFPNSLSCPLNPLALLFLFFFDLFFLFQPSSLVV